MERDIPQPKKCSETSSSKIYTRIPAKAFRKALKKYLKSGRADVDEIEKIIDDLSSGKKLDLKYRDHQLQGNMQFARECHIASNILLVYSVDENQRELHLIDMGSHSELFG